MNGRFEPPEPESTLLPARPVGFDVGGVAIVTLRTSGDDRSQDGVAKVTAIRRSDAGDWEGLERTCGPTDLEAWDEVRRFVGDRPVLTGDGLAFEDGCRMLDEAAGVRAPLPLTVGLGDLAALLEPGRLASLSAPDLVALLLDASLAPSPSGALLPPHLLAAATELVARFGDLGTAVHALALLGWGRAHRELAGTDAKAAARLALVLALVDRPRTWAGRAGVPSLARLEDGLLTRAAANPVDDEDPLAIMEPAVTDVMISIGGEPSLPPDTSESAPFLHEDFALLDDIFRVHLPQLFAPNASEDERTALYRKSQHRVAEEVARSLGSDELLLVHAPTGTGKTLGYILPALIWARRYGVRVGVATYTRALQSQAMEREVPRALEALAAAGLTTGFRVALLKGRERSLCWRALRSHTPTEGDAGETWLAWTGLALFGIRDVTGDLDRFPKRAPIRFDSGADYQAQLRVLIRQSRARSGCCRNEADKRTCAAVVARAKAERSHLVLTNQSFALARPEFFRRVVFDECEHLHDQAMSAWSHRVSFGGARRVLGRLHEAGTKPTRKRPKAALDRLSGQVLPGTSAHERLGDARTFWTKSHTALADLEARVLEYEGWRSKARLGRSDADLFGLFREYVLHSGAADGLVSARVSATTAMRRLENALAELAAELEGMRVRGHARQRRALELARVDLAEVSTALEHWLPVDEGAPRFSSAVFHDVERGAREELVLSALVLLPGDALGKHYYPELGSAAFVSATTRIGGSFDKAKGYLGLDRVAEIDEETGDLDRTAGTRRVTTFHAPEVFDYSRVLACVPRSVPSVQNRREYLDFLGRWLPWYAERTRGRMLVLFTSLADIRAVAAQCEPTFASRGLPLLWQGMGAADKEELSERFRTQVESTLFGVDTFWYGADFPGETLETLCIARLPYGVPDRYHHAQCAAIGIGAQRNKIYLPRALAKFRQGFGRLMRTATDRGVVIVLDNRVTERRHAEFMRDLPVVRAGSFDADRSARIVRGDLDLVGREAFEHLGVTADLQQRGLSPYFTGDARRAPDVMKPAVRDLPLAARLDGPGPIDIDPGELPF